MAVGDYIIFQVGSGGIIEETLVDPLALPIPGSSVCILRPNELSFKKATNSVTVSDYKEIVQFAGVQPYIQRQWHNGENWIPRDLWITGDQILPASPFLFDLGQWLDENIHVLSSEMPDKGIYIKMEIQYWMNHFYQDQGNTQYYHRTLTATKSVMLNILRTNIGQPYVPGSLSEIGFTGVYAVYDSYPALYDSILLTEQLSTLAFPVSVYFDETDWRLMLLLETDLNNQHSFESAAAWPVSFQVRMKVIQFSDYDRTNEYI